MTGRTITSVTVTHARTARRNASESEVVSRLTGRTVSSVRRHGKFLLIDLDHGYTLVAHLGMSGRFSLNTPADTKERHTHFVAVLDDGSEVRFVDPRTFGFIAAYDEDELSSSSLDRLGPDAWTDPPSPTELGETLAVRTAPIKALLLDQAPLAGLGNIYADEALHLAGIHPLTPGQNITEDVLESLLAAIATVLELAIERGGTTLEDLAYLLPDGQAGDNLGQLMAYGREDEPCRTCGAPIERIMVRGRSTHFCQNCQVML